MDSSVSVQQIQCRSLVYRYLDGPIRDSDPFALPGDSGSLIASEDASSAIGLLFAVNNKGDYGIFVPIQDVLRAFGNLELVSGHGV